MHVQMNCDVIVCQTSSDLRPSHQFWSYFATKQQLYIHSEVILHLDGYPTDEHHTLYDVAAYCSYVGLLCVHKLCCKVLEITRAAGTTVVLCCC